MSTILIWTFPVTEFCIPIYALTYCGFMVGFTSGLVLLNTYGPNIWKWKYVIPALMCMYASVFLMYIVPFYDKNLTKAIYIASTVLIGISISIVAFVSFKWWYYIYKLLNNSSLTQRDIICNVNFTIWILLVLSSFINSFAHGRPVWTEWTESTRNTYATLYAIYLVFVAILNRELLLLEVDAKNVSLSFDYVNRVVSA
jgi:hypothetical protein